MDSARGVDRRTLLGLAAAGAVAAPLIGAAPAAAADTPPDCRPGGAYDRYVAELAARDEFSGVVMLAHNGRTVLSRSYGLADRERGIPNHEGTAFNLSSAGKPFGPVAILQLAQQGKLHLWDTVGTHLSGFAPEIADRVTLHHLLSGTSGLGTPDEDVHRVFTSRDEVRAYNRQWARSSTAVAPPGTPTDHSGAEVAIPAEIVEVVSGMSYWDYVEQHIFRRAGMTGTGFYTRPQWLTDPHIAHAYMTVAGGGRVDAVRNLDQDCASPHSLGKNPGRAFIDAPGDGGFATAPDLVRFARALGDGTLLSKPYADLFTGAKIPHVPQGGGFRAVASADASFGAYGLPVGIVNGQWVYERAGGNPGSGANWRVYADSGWVGVILGNRDDFPLQDMIARETQAVLGRG
ncbi:MAG TPA: serine hydrolase domain-containing protein [Kutzneria sp.]|nr:serine hydrolase domain-containing protein [Kutzneria sp.]